MIPDRNYEIFSGNECVAIWENTRLTVLNEALLPLHLRRYTNVDAWLESRAADHTRPNIRLLKKALRLAE